MSYVELNQSRREDVWFLDSGWNNHMCANKEWFSDLDEEFQQSVKLENNSNMAVLGKVNIRLQIAGVTLVITDVFYIPKLKNNLLSVGQLQERGVAILIQHGVCKVYHPKNDLIVKTAMLQIGCSYCLQKFCRKLPLASKQFLKKTLTLGTADMGI
ncbi:uncharacterized protein LOC122304489 [Carya illinoinensis]|nr:uncharacterized protein LOC122304489 [Carya illinoinensis]